MSFSAENLQGKLSGVNETQESITTVGQWILFHKRHADQAADVWAHALTGAPPNRKLALLYVANEVVQQAKSRKKDVFVTAFARVLPAALTSAAAVVPPPVRDRIRRVVSVWRDRGVFSAEELARIEQAVSQGASQAPNQGANQNSFFSTPQAARSKPDAPPALSGAITAFQALDTAQQAFEASLKHVDLPDSQDQWEQQLTSLPPVQRLQSLEELQHKVAPAKESYTALEKALKKAGSELQSLVKTLTAAKVDANNSFESVAGWGTRISEKRDAVLEVINGDELPSPAVEPRTPEAETSVYTAKDAEEGYTGDDDGEPAYALSDSESKQQEEELSEDTPNAKKPKLEIDPNLASFLASMAGK